MRTIALFSSLCLAFVFAACGVMWGFGVFSGVSASATIGTIVGILLDNDRDRVDGARALQQQKRAR